MSIKTLNLGTEPKGLGGDTTRQAAGKINTNFSYLDSKTNNLEASLNTNVSNTEANTTEIEALKVSGVKGDKGDTGAQGIQGVKGDTGAKGDTGERGLQGIQGIQGIQGEKGEKGDSGTGGGGSGGAMSLDDGREIKTKLFEGFLGTGNFAQFVTYTDITADKVIGIQTLININGLLREALHSDGNYQTTISGGNIYVQPMAAMNGYDNSAVTVLITYLA